MIENLFLQDKDILLLKTHLNDKIPLLIYGPPGTTKSTIAEAFLKDSGYSFKNSENGYKVYEKNGEVGFLVEDVDVSSSQFEMVNHLDKKIVFTATYLHNITSQIVYKSILLSTENLSKEKLKKEFPETVVETYYPCVKLMNNANQDVDNILKKLELVLENVSGDVNARDAYMSELFTMIEDNKYIVPYVIIGAMKNLNLPPTYYVIFNRYLNTLYGAVSYILHFKSLIYELLLVSDV